MKKFLALLLTLAMTLSLMACGGNSGNSNNNNDDTDTGAGVTNNDDDNDKKGASAYKTFDDLTVEWDIYSDYLYYVDDVDGELYLRCDTPYDFRLEPAIYGFHLFNKEYGAIVVSSGEYTPGLTVDDAFDDVYRDFFIQTLHDYDHNHDWLEFTPDTTEHMTINGRDTIKFAGMQNADDYSTPYSYLVYGYCTVIENVPVVIAAVAGDPDKDYQKSTWSNDDMVMIKHYTDEMIYTLRALDHYEEYGTN